ncbi:hypothetical protein [Mesorhizobium sp. B2-4-6]|uniref:hypothetical protein n=1 Tax=Mesorhizobium sp. B2-4-6 TaxID=2589943 RepID=UPI00112D86B7|nr:hypothetical protein [Mesorhizobium sp. B2-4-6]TPL45367.1 hypothetical protein FJ957_20895 [Mesorhizobium sp. B2-4-6]
MSANESNRRRAFGEVVSVDAWHRPFSNQNPTADLHVDVTFSTGRVGGEKSSKVSFRLSLRRAEIVLVLPKTEPIDIKKSSIARDHRGIEGKKTLLKERKHSAGASGSVGVAVTTSTVSANASLEARGDSSISASEKVEIEEKIQLMVIHQSKTHDGNYRWGITPESAQTLNGKPWEAEAFPRGTLIDTRTDKNKGIPPTVSVEVRCLREDMIISDIMIKDEKKWDLFKKGGSQKAKLAAAGSYIRDKLILEGLEFESVDERFGAITLTSVVAEPESET